MKRTKVFSLLTSTVPKLWDLRDNVSVALSLPCPESLQREQGRGPALAL